MELVTSFLRFTTSSAVSQLAPDTAANSLMPALLVSLVLVVACSGWIFRR